VIAPTVGGGGTTVSRMTEERENLAVLKNFCIVQYCLVLLIKREMCVIEGASPFSSDARHCLLEHVSLPLVPAQFISLVPPHLLELMVTRF
jgi:hypothetical protein